MIRKERWTCLCLLFDCVYHKFIYNLYTCRIHSNLVINMPTNRRWGDDKKKKKTKSLEVFSIHVMSLYNIQSFQAMNQIHCNTIYSRTHTHIWYHNVCAKGSSVSFGCARMTGTNDLSRLVNVAAKELFMFRAENSARMRFDEFEAHRIYFECFYSITRIV